MSKSFFVLRSAVRYFAIFVSALIISACSSSSDDEQAIGDESVSAVHIATTQRPDSFITSPTANGGTVTIPPGDSLTFAGYGTDPDGNYPLRYFWDFGGAAPNSASQNPGAITFSREGSFAIKMRVTDSSRTSDATPAQITVVVSTAPNNQPSADNIVSPATDQAISVGDRVNFSAQDLPANPNASYRWNFDGAIPNAAMQNPGDVMFTRAGVYHIFLSIIDVTGVQLGMSHRAITVNDINVTNAPPNGTITLPASNQIIAVGDSVTFTGTGVDANNQTPLSYLWTFSGAAPNSTLQNPGSIKFNNAGVYAVRLTVADSTGLKDPTPAQVTITVNNTANRNQAPQGLIVTPLNDLIVNKGDVVEFAGDVIDPDGPVPFTYQWSFGSPSQASTAKSPGNVTFTKAGVFTVTLNVKDGSGAPDPVPATRTITVRDVAQSTIAPDAVINTPTSDMTISVGSSLAFTGSGVDPDNSLPLTYYWNFDGAAPNTTVQNPNQILFSRAGTYRVSLNVIDNSGLSDPTPAVRVINVVAPNTPSANIAPNGVIAAPATSTSIFVGQSLYFNANATDPDGDPSKITYRWNFDSATINSTAKTPGQVNFTRVGTYRVTLTVTDQLGLSDPTPDMRVIVVKPQQSANNPPTGTITLPSANQTITINDSIYFSATGSDPDGNLPLKYIWDFAGIAPNSLDAVPGLVTFTQAGVYNVVLTVIDSLGLADATPASVTITVRDIIPGQTAPNGVIAAPATNQTISVGQSVFFSGTGNSPTGNTPLSYAWQFGGAAPNSSQQSPGNIVFNAPGVYTVSLTVRDRSNVADPTPDTRVITVQSVTPNIAPDSVIALPTSATVNILVGQAVYFSGSGSDPDNNLPLSYLWTFGGAAPNSIAQTPGNIVFASAGTYQVRFAVTDGKGLSDASPATVTVVVAAPQANQAPNSVITLPSSSQVITVGSSLYFSGAGTDPDGNTPFTYSWDFGGGALNSSAQVPGSVQFSQAGTFLVSFAVTDSLGLRDPTPATMTITVNQSPNSNRAPNGIITSPIGNQTIAVGASVNFAGLATDPDGNLPLSYFWNFDGVTLNSARQNPGAITFRNAGVYTVTLTVKDSLGLADPIPATVTITVGNVVANQAPNGAINTPNGDQTVVRGSLLTFQGSGTDPDNNTPLTYYWDFGGATFNSNVQNPGPVLFNTVGVFDITLRVTDSKGLADSTPDVVRVTVVNSTSNQAPNSFIDSPLGNMSISVNSAVNFVGHGVDADNNTPLSYLWNFGGAAPNSTAQNAGVVTFTTPGIYTVSYTVTDAKGLADPTPATATITVSNVANRNLPPNGNITTPAQDVTINPGTSLFFTSNATDPEGDTNLTYLWTFDGVVPNRSTQNPGLVQFTQAGSYRVTLTVVDSLGAMDPTPDAVVVTVTGTVSNQAPDSVIKTPVSDMTIQLGSTLSFEGIATDPDNNLPLGYLWDFAGVVPNSTALVPGVVTFNRVGIFTVRFTVTDGKGLKDSTPATRTITVQNIAAVNEAPVGAISSPNTNVTIYQGDTLKFVGAGFDPDGNVPLSYRWNFAGAAPDSTVAEPGNVTFTRAGTFNIRLTVTDSLGLADPTPVVRTVTVLSSASSGNAPTATIDSPIIDQTIVVGDTVDFRGSAYDPDNNTPFTWLWNFDGAVPNSRVQNPGVMTFNKAGTYRVQLSVTDSTGMSDPLPPTRFITVKPANAPAGNLPPNGNIASPPGDMAITVGNVIDFAATGTDPDGIAANLVYRWNFDGVTPNANIQNPGRVLFDQVGTYRIVMTVTDELGLSDPTPSERMITVLSAVTANLPPNGTIISPANNLIVNVGDVVNFNGTATDADGNYPLRYYWDFAGVIANRLGARADVTFTQPGTYTILLKVTDALGYSDPTPASVTITVRDVAQSNRAPDGTIVSPASDITINAGSSINFQGSAFDPDGNTVTYRWDFGSAFPASSSQNPGVKTFTRAGSYIVTLKVTDQLGLSDPTPAMRTITVR